MGASHMTETSPPNTAQLTQILLTNPEVRYLTERATTASVVRVDLSCLAALADVAASLPTVISLSCKAFFAWVRIL